MSRADDFGPRAIGLGHNDRLILTRREGRYTAVIYMVARPKVEGRPCTEQQYAAAADLGFVPPNGKPSAWWRYSAVDHELYDALRKVVEAAPLDTIARTLETYIRSTSWGEALP